MARYSRGKRQRNTAGSGRVPTKLAHLQNLCKARRLSAKGDISDMCIRLACADIERTNVVVPGPDATSTALVVQAQPTSSSTSANSATTSNDVTVAQLLTCTRNLCDVAQRFAGEAA